MAQGLESMITASELAALERLKKDLAGDSGDAGEGVSESSAQDDGLDWVDDADAEVIETDAGEVLSVEEVGELFAAFADEDFAEVDRWLDEAERRTFEQEYDAAHAEKAGGADRNRGGAETLRRYWTVGEGGAKIRWGTGGDFTRCVEQLTEHLGVRAKGYCALRHREMNGVWPGDKANTGKALPAKAKPRKRGEGKPKSEAEQQADREGRDYTRDGEGQFSGTGRSDSAVDGNGKYDPNADLEKYVSAEDLAKYREDQAGGGSGGSGSGSGGSGDAAKKPGEKPSGDAAKKPAADAPVQGANLPKDGLPSDPSKYKIDGLDDVRGIVKRWDDVPSAARGKLHDRIVAHGVDNGASDELLTEIDGLDAPDSKPGGGKPSGPRRRGAAKPDAKPDKPAGDAKPGGDPSQGKSDELEVAGEKYRLKNARDFRRLIKNWDEIPAGDRAELRRRLLELATERDDLGAALALELENLKAPSKDSAKSAPRPRPRERKDSAMQMEHKVVPVVGQKVLDDDQGIVETIVSVTGVVDEVDDDIRPGAYAKTLLARTPKGVWGHDWMTPVSKTLAIEELLPGDNRLPAKTRNGDAWPSGAGGLLVKTKFNLETQRGRDAYSDVKFFGDEQEWSIGYQVPVGGSKMNQKTGVREIETIDLYEYSPVLFGAMPLAHTSSVKTAQQTLAMIKGQRTADGAHVITRTMATPAQLAARKSAAAKTETKDVWVEIEGSVEDVISDVRHAVQAQYGDANDSDMAWDGGRHVWTSVQATFPDRVLYRVYGPGHEEDEFWEAPYTYADDTVTLGAPRQVRVVASVEPMEVSANSVATVLGTMNEVGKSLWGATETKAGRVLNAANVAALEQALVAIQNVLDAHNTRMAPPDEAAAGGGDTTPIDEVTARKRGEKSAAVAEAGTEVGQVAGDQAAAAAAAAADAAAGGDGAQQAAADDLARLADLYRNAPADTVVALRDATQAVADSWTERGVEISPELARQLSVLDATLERGDAGEPRGLSDEALTDRVAKSEVGSDEWQAAVTEWQRRQTEGAEIGGKDPEAAAAKAPGTVAEWLTARQAYDDGDSTESPDDAAMGELVAAANDDALSGAWATFKAEGDDDSWDAMVEASEKLGEAGASETGAGAGGAGDEPTEADRLGVGADGKEIDEGARTAELTDLGRELSLIGLDAVGEEPNASEHFDAAKAALETGDLIGAANAFEAAGRAARDTGDDDLADRLDALAASL